MFENCQRAPIRKFCEYNRMLSLCDLTNTTLCNLAIIFPVLFLFVTKYEHVLPLSSFMWLASGGTGAPNTFLYCGLEIKEFRTILALFYNLSSLTDQQPTGSSFIRVKNS